MEKYFTTERKLANKAIDESFEKAMLFCLYFFIALFLVCHETLPLMAGVTFVQNMSDKIAAYLYDSMDYAAALCLILWYIHQTEFVKMNLGKKQIIQDHDEPHTMGVPIDRNPNVAHRFLEI